MNPTDVLYHPLSIAIALGILGSIIRVVLQKYRDGTWKEGDIILCLLFLGAVGGGISYVFEGYTLSVLSATALGFVAPDVLENFLSGYSPVE